MNENEIATEIVDAAFKIHTKLGPGLFEYVYEAILEWELKKRGLIVVCQQSLPVTYEDIRLNIGFRVDLMVENMVIVEIKSNEKILPVHKKQLLTYLRLSEKHLGLLINFGDALIKNGITRIVNNLKE